MKKKTGGITFSFLTITIIPMLIMGLVITVSGSSFILKSLQKNVQKQLSNVSNTFLL